MARRDTGGAAGRIVPRALRNTAGGYWRQSRGGWQSRGMARVPILSAPQVPLQPMTDAKFHVRLDEASAEAPGEGLERLGRAGQKFAATLDPPKPKPQPDPETDPQPHADPQAQLDEAQVRKADNALTQSWEDMSKSFFDAAGEAAATGAPAVSRSLEEAIAQQRAALANDRQRSMFDGVAGRRLSDWTGRIARHRDTAIGAFNEEQSDARRMLAAAMLAAAAGRGDEDDVRAQEQVLAGEAEARARRIGLGPAEGVLAGLKAIGTAHAQAVERMADSDPARAQAWLDGHRDAIGDPAEVARLEALLRPYVETAQADATAADIRAGTKGRDAQRAQVDTLGLPPEQAAAVRRSLDRATAADDAATRAAQKEAADRIWPIVLDPAATSLLALPAGAYGALGVEERAAVDAAVAANARMAEPAPDPALYLQLADKAARGELTVDDVRRAWGRMPHEDWNAASMWQQRLAAEGLSSDSSALLRRIDLAARTLVGGSGQDVIGNPRTDALRQVSRIAASAVRAAPSTVRSAPRARPTGTARSKNFLTFAQVRDLVKANNRSSLPDALIIALIYKESTFDSNVKNNQGSNAAGFMQLTPGAFKDVNASSHTDYRYESDVYDAAKNIEVGTAYLQIRVDRAKSLAAGLDGYGTGKGYHRDIVAAQKALTDLGNEEESMKALRRIFRK